MKTQSEKNKRRIISMYRRGLIDDKVCFELLTNPSVGLQQIFKNRYPREAFEDKVTMWILQRRAYMNPDKVSLGIKGHIIHYIMVNGLWYN